MKFQMGAETLTTLTRATSTSTEDLGTLVRQLSEAAEPLEGRFRGAARSVFDNFKLRTDEIAIELNGALGAVLAGISGMDKAFQEGEATQADQLSAAESGSAFEAARFGSSR